MTSIESLLLDLRSRFPQTQSELSELTREVTMEVERDALLQTARLLRDDPAFKFEQLIDLCGVDYSEYGVPESQWQGKRFAVVYHLLSVTHNRRLRLKVFVNESNLVVPSVIPIWSCANWFEREAFDLFGILFDGHPDLRRLLTDYGFIGHPFRKDFPLSGHVEMRYDPNKKRVVYEPVSIEPRINVPKVIRHDHRYVELGGKDS